MKTFHDYLSGSSTAYPQSRTVERCIIVAWRILTFTSINRLYCSFVPGGCGVADIRGCYPTMIEEQLFIGKRHPKGILDIFVSVSVFQHKCVEEVRAGTLQPCRAEYLA